MEVKYFTAEAAGPGAASGRDEARLLAAAADGEEGGDGSTGSGGRLLVWDQARLRALPSSAFVFSPSNPVLNVSSCFSAPRLTK